MNTQAVFYLAFDSPDFAAGILRLLEMSVGNFLANMCCNSADSSLGRAMDYRGS